jgi:crotonobetainyl-CoA:carnitine CoA-transferase CaiB-like acyl-CoA transferase
MNRDPHLASWYHHAPYGVYQLKDREMVVSANPLPSLAEALDSPELRAMANIDRYTERNRVAKVFAEVLAKRSYADVAAAFDKHNIWYGPVHNFDDVADDPQTKALGVFRTEEIWGRQITLVNHPLRYDDKTPELRVKGTDVGQHTREILGELGIPASQIDDLLRRKVVAEPSGVDAKAQQATTVAK